MEPSDGNRLYTLLGELRADMKHVLKALEEGKRTQRVSVRKSLSWTADWIRSSGLTSEFSLGRLSQALSS